VTRSDHKSSIQWVWWIAALAVAVRVGAALATGGLLRPEVFEYDSAARALIEGKGFVYYHIGIPYYSYMAPFHSWLGAASYWISGSMVPLMLAQCAAGGALTLATAALATRLTHAPFAGELAAVLVAFHPGLAVYSALKAHPLVFDALFFTLTLLLCIRLFERTTPGRAVALGAVVGVGALSRGTIVIFLPMAASWLLLVAGAGRRRQVVHAMVLTGAVATAIIAPWTIRCSLLHGQFIFLLTTDAEDFWRGNNPYATGHSYVDANRIVLTSIPPDELADLQGQPDELAQARWFAQRARTFVRENPAAFVRLTFQKLFQFWWFAPQTGVLYSTLWLRLYQAFYVGLLLLAAIGGVAAVRSSEASRRNVCLLLSFLIVLSVLQSLYYVEGRHRWAVEPMLMALGGVGGAAFLATVRRERTDAATASMMGQ
jgi:4-amino-4-deoxy-L-arabinose transferase-like glycosyltransferase